MYTKRPRNDDYKCNYFEHTHARQWSFIQNLQLPWQIKIIKSCWVISHVNSDNKSVASETFLFLQVSSSINREWWWFPVDGHTEGLQSAGIFCSELIVNCVRGFINLSSIFIQTKCNIIGIIKSFKRIKSYVQILFQTPFQKNKKPNQTTHAKYANTDTMHSLRLYVMQ
jgi:hypothetical protein